jgi:antitoxin component YwqK of YwqJK toxin-antitoxin module
MNKYITSDLIKFVISPYICYHEITPICNDYIILHNHRINSETINFKSKSQNVFITKTKADNNIITMVKQTGCIHNIDLYKNGKLHGRQIIYNRNKIISLKSYKNGFAHGKFYHYNHDFYDRHDCINSYTCYNNFKIGLYKQFYDDGTLRSIWNYSCNESKEGYQKIYNIEGGLVCKVYYANNLKEGTEKVYFYEGNINGIYNYKDGKLEGISIIYDLSGKVTKIGNYINNCKNGIWNETIDDESKTITYHMGDVVDDGIITTL